MLSPSSSPMLAALPVAVDRRFGAVAVSLVLAAGLLLGGAVLAAERLLRSLRSRHRTRPPAEPRGLSDHPRRAPDPR